MSSNISIIAAVAKNRVIGINNALPWHLPADLTYFKRQTLAKPIIMGRNTFLSIGRALPKRRNIVLTTDRNFSAKNIEVCHSLAEAIALCASEPEIMIIGGGLIYEQALQSASKLYLTIVDAAPVGDAYFPDWEDGSWQQISTVSHAQDADNDHAFKFTVWERT